MNYKYVFWLLFAMSLFLFFGPVSVPEVTGLGLDKLGHLALFGTMTYTGVVSFRHRYRLIFLLLIYSVAVEFIQGAILPWRSFDFLDAVAGIMGILIIVILRRSRRI